MKWFKHDTTATTDSKLKKLILRHGAIGYAVYFHCLELIAGDITETKVTFELEHDSEIIADNLKIRSEGARSGAVIVEDIMRTIIELGLFEENNGHVFCFKMLKRMDTSMTSNKSMRNLIAKAKSQSSQTANIDHDDNELSCHDTIMTESCDIHDTIMTESCDIMLEEKRREEKRREENRLEGEEKREDDTREEGEESISPPPQEPSAQSVNDAEPPPEPPPEPLDPPHDFSASSAVNGECLPELQECHRAMFDRWVGAGLPLSRASARSYFTFCCRELKLALGHWQGKNLAPEELLEALDNYISLAGLIRSGQSWMDTIGGFDHFARHTLDFLGGNFQLERYKKRSGQDAKPFDKDEEARKVAAMMAEMGIVENH